MLTPDDPARAGSQPLIHWEELANILESLGPEGPEAIAMMVGLFEEVIPPQLDALEAALAQGDGGRLRHEAHRLRGGCLQLGARAMAALCRRLEQSDAPEELPALVAALRVCYGQTLALLHCHLARPPGAPPPE